MPTLPGRGADAFVDGLRIHIDRPFFEEVLELRQSHQRALLGVVVTPLMKARKAGPRQLVREVVVDGFEVALNGPLEAWLSLWANLEAKTQIGEKAFEIVAMKLHAVVRHHVFRNPIGRPTVLHGQAFDGNFCRRFRQDAVTHCPYQCRHRGASEAQVVPPWHSTEGIKRHGQSRSPQGQPGAFVDEKQVQGRVIDLDPLQDARGLDACLADPKAPIRTGLALLEHGHLIEVGSGQHPIRGSLAGWNARCS